MSVRQVMNNRIAGKVGAANKKTLRAEAGRVSDFTQMLDIEDVS